MEPDYAGDILLIARNLFRRNGGLLLLLDCACLYTCVLRIAVSGLRLAALL